MSIPGYNWLRVSVGVLGVVLAAAPALAQNAEGLFVTVPNPITSDAVARIKAQINSRLEGETPRPKPSVIVFDFTPGGKPAATAEIGACRDLAQLIKSKQGAVNTVAFVHAKVSGHTVLPVLACRELVMSKEAAVGEIASENIEPLQEPDKATYQFYFGRDSEFPLVRKMFDRDVQLRRGSLRAKPEQKVYIDARDKEAEKQAGGLEKVPGIPDGQLGLYNRDVARSVNLCKSTAENRTELCETYGLPPSAGRDDPLGGEIPDVYHWKLTKEVDAAMRESVNRVIRDVRKKGGNVLILEIDCTGNDVITAREIADDLIKAQNPEGGEKPLQVIGFIPGAASPAGTVIALGCTDIVMYRPKADADGHEAEIGDFSKYIQSAKPADVEAALASIRQLAESQGYPGVLIDGMFKKDLVVLRVTGKSDKRLRRLMSAEEFEKNKADWNVDKQVKAPGQLLKLNATAAAENGLARFVVEGNTFKDVCAVYGYKDAKDPDPGWLDRFAEFLRIPVVTVLLVVIGFTGLILELKVPGLTVPGIIAALCFILVFWSQSRFSGQTFVLALMLFLMGLVLVGLEIFVLPGFGAPGIFGILCMLAGLGLVTLDRVPESGAEWGNLGMKISQYLFALMGAVGLAILIARYLPKLPGANRLVLNAPTETAATAAEVLPGAGEAAELLGAIGTTSTPLRPAGVVKFADKFVDVVSDGGFIPAGTRVQVIQVEGTRIVVKEV
jgi:membrane-bound ClpP family serine protease